MHCRGPNEVQHGRWSGRQAGRAVARGMAGTCLVGLQSCHGFRASS